MKKTLFSFALSCGYLVGAITVLLVLIGSPVLDAEATSSLSVLVGDVVVEGGFDELTDATGPMMDAFKGRRSTVEELQALAQALELVYHDAGYFLVRVTIPPQEVNDGGTFRLLVIDGYLEGIDLEAVPARTRSHLEGLFTPITNQRRLKMAEFERTVVLSRQMPGMSIQTTLMSDEDVGASLLVVQGEWTKFGGSVRLSSQLSEAAAPWDASMQFHLNQPFGRGEQITAHLSGPASTLFSPMGPNANNRTIGTGFRLPLGYDGMSLHLGYTASDTFTPSPHWIIPATRSNLQRTSLELSKPVRLSRTDELRLSGILEATDQSLQAPDFEATLHQDGLRVLRLAATSRYETTSGARLSLTLQLSQGLTALGARTDRDVQETGIPFSRPGAAPGFQKVSMTASWRYPLASRFALTSTLRGQYALKGPVPTTELFGLSGGNALPSLALGIGANDHGWTLREEIDTHLSLLNGNLPLSLYSYVTGGQTANQTSKSPVAMAGGVGLRGDVGPTRFSLEYAWGRANSVSDQVLVASVEVAF